MTTLTSRERIDRCFRHFETDRPGIYVRGVDESYPQHMSYTPLRELVLSKCDLRAIYNVEDFKPKLWNEYKTEPVNEDFERHVSVLNTPAGDLYRSYMAGLKGKPGYTEKHPVESIEDAGKYLSMPEDEVRPDTEKFTEMDGKLGDRGIVLVNLGLNPAGIVAELLGSERFALWSVEYRDILHRLMEREMNVLIKNVKKLLDVKIGPYFGMLGEEYITPPLHGPHDFYDFNVNYDRPVMDLVHDSGGYVHIHCHGPIRQVLKYFIEMGTDVLHPVEAPPMGNVSVGEAKDILRRKVCIEGNIQIGDMYEKSADEIRDMTLEVVKKAFDDSEGLILCPTASPYVPVMTQRAFDNYRALIDTVLEYKK